LRLDLLEPIQTAANLTTSAESASRVERTRGHVALLDLRRGNGQPLRARDDSLRSPHPL